MEVVRKITGEVKKIVDKLGIFNIVWFVLLIFALWFVGNKGFATSYSKINVYFNEEVALQDYTINMTTDLAEPTAKVDGDKLVLSVYTSGDTVEEIELIVSNQDAECILVETTSRYRTLKKFEMENNRISVFKEGENTKIVFTENFIDEINSSFSRDTNLKMEVMLIVLAFFVAIKCIDIFFSHKLYKRFSYICLFIALMLIVHQYGNTDIKRVHRELNIYGFISCTPVSEEEFFYQSFIPTEKTSGISVRLATYGDELQGTYELRVYDAEDNRVMTKTIPGIEVIDNLYYDIDFEQKLSAGETHKFTIVKTDEEFTDENMCLWRTEVDHYADGELIDLQNMMVGDVEFDMYEEGVNLRVYALWVVLIFFVLVLICKKGNEDSKNFYKYVICIYGGILIIFVTKILYCVDYSNLGIYDEMAQVSFVTYFEENPGVIVPEYEEAMLLIPDSMKPTGVNKDVVSLNQSKGVFYGRNSETVNYLFHPSLYYKLMSMTNSVTSDGELVHVNIDRLRFINVGIIVSALLIVFYIGITRLKRNTYYHLLFAALCTGLATLYQMAPMINNDNLSFLALAIYMLGVIRVSEDKRGFLSYLCIALGISIAACTKHTALLYVAITSLFLVLRIMLKEKSIKVLLNKGFIMTIPIYAVVVWYYVSIYMKYGSFTPSLNGVLGDELYDYPILIKKIEDRAFVELGDLIIKFFNSFATVWNRIVVILISNTTVYSFVRVLRNMIFILPIAIPFFNLKDKKENKNAYYYIFEGVAIAVGFAFFYQLISGIGVFYGFGGRIASQSRYYICMLPLFAFCIVYFFSSKIEEKFGDNTKVSIGEKGISINTIIHAIICVCVLGLIVV